MIGELLAQALAEIGHVVEIQHRFEPEPLIYLLAAKGRLASFGKKSSQRFQAQLPDIRLLQLNHRAKVDYCGHIFHPTGCTRRVVPVGWVCDFAVLAVLIA